MRSTAGCGLDTFEVGQRLRDSLTEWCAEEEEYLQGSFTDEFLPKYKLEGKD